MLILSKRLFGRQSALAVLGCMLTLAAQAKPSGRHALQGHVPKATAGLKPLRALDGTNHMRLALGLPLRHPSELQALLADLYNPNSAQYRHYIKPAEFTERFGPTEEDYAAVAAFAKSHGLSVVRTHANRLLLDVEGSAADVEKAFNIHLNVFKHPTEDRTFFAPDSEPTVEPGLPLNHISGLDNYQFAKANIVHRGGSRPAQNYTGSGPSGAFLGRDFRAAYAGSTPLDGAGQTLALVEFDTFYTADITSYETSAGLPPVQIAKVPVDSFSGAPGGNDEEVSLDIEMAISMAPGLAQVLVYEAFYGDLSVNDDMLNQMAVDDLASQISCSWIFMTDATSDLIFQEMAAQGQSFFTASGDDGAYYFNQLPLETDPNITVVGGTTLTTTGPGGAWTSEVVWNGFTSGLYTGGSSGGISAAYPIPFWQQSVNMSSNGGSTLWRNIPDVSMIADGVWVVYGDLSGAEPVGGTSCATPLWAGLTALINQQEAQYGRPPVGFMNPALYGLAQSSLYPSIFHDITTGNNTNANGQTEFFAVPGYDLCTGWGTPNGQALINAFAPPDSLELTPGGGAAFEVAHGVALSGATATMVLKNTEATTVDWVMGPRPQWLSASITHAITSNNYPVIITLSLNASATNLPPGNYLEDLLFTNLTSGITHIFPIAMEVVDPLILLSNTSLYVSGPSGGPYNGAPQTFVFGNATASAINWTAQTGSPYISLFPSGGSLASEATTNFTASIADAATNLLISVQTGNLGLADASSGHTQNVPFTIDIGNGDFETGDFSDWTFSGNTNDNFVASTSEIAFDEYIHSGSFAAILGEPSDTATLSQTLPTVPGQAYLISLFLDNPVGGPVNEFAVKWGGATLFQKLEVATMLWTNMQFVASATTSSTTLEFDFRNDPDAFGLDDITVTPVAQPNFTTVNSSNGSIVFSWSATPGFSYQLKYAGSLNMPQWVSLGPPITATNSMMTASDLQVDGQRFYRVFFTVP